MGQADKSNDAPPCFVFAGGGTGGHLFPGLAVADALRALCPVAKITFLTTDRALDRDLLSKTEYRQIEQRVRPFTAAPVAFLRFAWAWYASRRDAAQRLREIRPSAVLGLGGYAAGPAVVEARRLGIRSAILNPDAIPGRANRVLARRCDLVVQQWDASTSHFPATAKVKTWGCPIRADFANAVSTALNDDSWRRFGLEPRKRTLLVTGASQGARTINRAMHDVWPRFFRVNDDWQLLHLSGALDVDETRSAYEKAGVPAQVLAFTHEMAAAIAIADVVVSRAGASTLAELTTLGKPSILLPYPFHKDMHQTANARVLVDEGAAILVDDLRDPAANAGPLLAAMNHYAESQARASAAGAAKRLARPDAAQHVAQWLVNEAV